MSNYTLKHIDIEITKSCNWDCIHCSARGEAYSEEELTIEEIKNILKQGKELGVEDIGFTGGEPFLKKNELLEVLEYCKVELGTKTHMHTNGSLLKRDKITKNILSLLDKMSVTLLGFRDTHDKLTRTPGAYTAVMDGIKILRELNASFYVYFVPMKDNYKEYPELAIDLITNYGLQKIRVLTLSPTGRAMKEWESLALNEKEIRWLDEQLKNVAKKYDIDIKAGFCTRLFYRSLGGLKGHEFCKSGMDRCHINALGDVFPCTASSGQSILSAGNLRKFNMNLKYLWQSGVIFQLLRYYRKYLPDPCSRCELYTNCGGGCRVYMMYRYGNITIPDPRCNHVQGENNVFH